MMAAGRAGFGPSSTFATLRMLCLNRLLLQGPDALLAEVES